MSDEEIFEVGRKTIFWMIASFVIAILVVVFALLIIGYQDRLTRVPGEMKAAFIALRFVNNPDCFAYEDPVTQRVFQNTVDLSKFTKERLNDCYQTDPKDGYKTFNFELMLYSSGVSVATNNYFKMPHFDLPWFAIMVWDGTSFTRDSLTINVQENYVQKNT